MPPSHQRRCPRGCVKSHFLCWESPPRARMASLQNNFLDFWGLFTQPQDLPPRALTLQDPTGLSYASKGLKAFAGMTKNRREWLIL